MNLWALLMLFATRYAAEGVVVEADTAARRVTVAHRPIANYMPAMTMAFRVDRDVALDTLTPGTRIAFELKVGKTTSLVQHVRVLGVSSDPALPPASLKKALIGQKMPLFTLVDESEKTVSLSDFQGKVVVVDFIYTRCPLPDVCPRLSANFASVSKKLRARDVTFFSITIDPQFDTPAVLSEYARRWQAGESWKFLTGTPEQIRNVAELFGLIYWPEDGSLTHTVSTAIIGRDGTVAARIDGAGYRPDELRALIERALQ